MNHVCHVCDVNLCHVCPVHFCHVSAWARWRIQREERHRREDLQVLRELRRLRVRQRRIELTQTHKAWIKHFAGLKIYGKPPESKLRITEIYSLVSSWLSVLNGSINYKENW
jgi:hypothetical protein